MANTVTAKKNYGAFTTLWVEHDTANPSTDFELLPALQNGTYQLIGFSLVPANSGTLTIYSGAGSSTANAIWQRPVTSGTPVEFTSPFVNGAKGEAINIRASAILGNITLVFQTW